MESITAIFHRARPCVVIGAAALTPTLSLREKRSLNRFIASRKIVPSPLGRRLG